MSKHIVVISSKAKLPIVVGRLMKLNKKGCLVRAKNRKEAKFVIVSHVGYIARVSAL